MGSSSAGARATRPSAKATPLVLYDAQNRPLTVTEQNLEGEFQISFNASGMSPSKDVEAQKTLVGLMGPYLKLWEAVRKDDQGSVLARAYMEALAERFSLPKSLHPELIEARMASEGETPKLASAPRGNVLTQAAPPSGPVAPPTSTPGTVMGVAGGASSGVTSGVLDTGASEEVRQGLGQLRSLPATQAML